MNLNKIHFGSPRVPTVASMDVSLSLSEPADLGRVHSSYEYMADSVVLLVLQGVGPLD